MNSLKKHKIKSIANNTSIAVDQASAAKLGSDPGLSLMYSISCCQKHAIVKYQRPEPTFSKMMKAFQAPIKPLSWLMTNWSKKFSFSRYAYTSSLSKSRSSNIQSSSSAPSSSSSELSSLQHGNTDSNKLLCLRDFVLVI